MSDLDDLTPRTRRESELMRAAARWALSYRRESAYTGDLASWGVERDFIENRFPIPTRTVTKPREITLNGYRYRMHEDAIQTYYLTSGTWTSVVFDLGRIRAFADLIANPTETVEEEVEE